MSKIIAPTVVPASGEAATAQSAAAFTPGPWFLCDRGDYSDYEGDSRVILGDAGTLRGAVVHTNGDEEYEANARLIVAATELLGVLREMFEAGPVNIMFAGNPIACDDLERRARAAILKATGATQ